MYIPEIPQNSLTDEITQIVELSKKLENEYDFEFDPPLSEEKIILWEKENNIAITAVKRQHQYMLPFKTKLIYQMLTFK